MAVARIVHVSLYLKLLLVYNIFESIADSENCTILDGTILDIEIR
jgi:hypothetical protein